MKKVILLLLVILFKLVAFQEYQRSLIDSLDYLHYRSVPNYISVVDGERSL